MSDDDYEDPDDDVEEEEEYLDCALDFETGQCGKAGSEECDWHCPYSHGEFYCGSKAWHRRQDRLEKERRAQGQTQERGGE